MNILDQGLRILYSTQYKQVENRVDIDHICQIIMGSGTDHAALLKRQIGPQAYPLVSLCQLATCKLTYSEMLVFLINSKRYLHPDTFHRCCNPMLLNLSGLGKIYNSNSKEGYLATGSIIWRSLEWEKVRESGVQTVLVNNNYKELMHPLNPYTWKNQSSSHRTSGTLLKIERSNDFLMPVIPRMTLNRARCFTDGNHLVFVPWRLGQITYNVLAVFLDISQLRQCLSIECTFEILVLRSSEIFFLVAFPKNPPYVQFRKNYVCNDSEDAATVLTERASAQFCLTDASNLLGWNADETFKRFNLIESKSTCKWKYYINYVTLYQLKHYINRMTAIKR